MTEVLGPKIVTDLKEEFISELQKLGKISTKKARKQFVLVVGGFPGSGKTTAGEILQSILPGTVHIQSNNARFLLSQKGLGYGRNPHRIVDVVLRHFLAQSLSVIMDGMITEKEERGTLESAAREFNAEVFYLVTTCHVILAQERARARYKDGKLSTFWDWRAKPEKFEEYLKSMQERKDALVREVPSIPNIQVIENNRTKDDLNRGLRRSIDLFGLIV